MRIAVTRWGARVSPAFDTAGRLLIIDLRGTREERRCEIGLEDLDLGGRVRLLRRLGVAVLVCGAITREAQARLAARDVAVIAEVCGPLEEVLAAWREGRLRQAQFYVRGAPPAEVWGSAGMHSRGDEA
jgi:predicted Fe-Mo cluster-binding NifX family protein